MLLGVGSAQADRYRGRPVVREHRGGYQGGYTSQPIVRDHRGGGNVSAGVTVRFNGTPHQDRRVVYRRPLQPNRGRFTFYNGQTVVYQQPVVQTRYYDYNYRPQPIVENYPSQNGYVWVNGSWSWNGYEWTWTAGYYAPDPAISTYYDDGSYDTYR